MVTLSIDGIHVEVEEGTTILEAARKIGGKVVPPAGPELRIWFRRDTL